MEVNLNNSSDPGVEAAWGTLRLALVQMNSSSEDVQVNIDKASAAIDEASGNGANLIVLPEFFNTPYFAQTWDYGLMKYAETTDGAAMQMVTAKAKAHGVYICATIFEQRGPGLYYDTAFLVSPEGEIIGRYEKVHPAAVKSLEKVYFRPGSNFPVWDINGVKVAAIICYDHYFPEAARCAMLNGAELIVGPFAAPMATTGLWSEVMTVRAFENGVYMAPCNKVGVEGDWTFRGRSMIVDPLGNCVAEASETEESVIYADIASQIVAEARVAYPMIRDRVPDSYGPITRTY